MRQEIKICLPMYKIVYSVLFLVILSLVRGVTDIREIGITLDTNIALLAVVFCAETYIMERGGKRWEIFALYPMKNKKQCIFRRLMIQNVYLWLMSYIGYFFFYWQSPVNMGKESFGLIYGSYMAAVTVTILFWSTVSMTLADILRNQWPAIGIAVILWLLINSTFGDKLLGKFNIFAYSFQGMDRFHDGSWLCGKGLGLLLAALMAGAIPYILKKRG